MMEAEAMQNGTPSSVPTQEHAVRASEQLSETVKLEHQLVRVPHEQLKRLLRARGRLVDKEVNAMVAGVVGAGNMSKDEAVQHLNSLVSRLQGLKRKLDESSRNEMAQLQRSRARLDHLSMLRVGIKEVQAKCDAMRVDRILVDYMLRSSCYSTALNLAASSGLQDVSDIDLFVDAHKVIGALNNRDCSEALAWCNENKSKLKKAKSKLEFKLRLQEFIELVRSEQMLEAITYARKHLAAWASTEMKELQQAMATLAFRSNTDCDAYQILFDMNQWDNLIEQFKQELYRLYGMTVEPLLSIYLQAGLSALKTPFCYEEDCTKEDPLSQSILRQLAEPLPFAKHIRSKLVCYISKELMNEDNPPLVLPNGYVYSKKAMEEMARRNHGRIVCPRTGFECTISELSKAFIC